MSIEFKLTEEQKNHLTFMKSKPDQYTTKDCEEFLEKCYNENVVKPSRKAFIMLPTDYGFTDDELEDMHERMSNIIRVYFPDKNVIVYSNIHEKLNDIPNTNVDNYERINRLYHLSQMIARMSVCDVVVNIANTRYEYGMTNMDDILNIAYRAEIGIIDIPQMALGEKFHERFMQLRKEQEERWNRDHQVRDLNEAPYDFR